MRQINQRGIAIGPILYIVAILAVLVSAIAAGAGSFSGDTSAISAKAQASAILEYANEVKFAVDRVLGKGCTNTEISFENPIVSGYTNPNAPSDKSCHVFDVNGGGIIFKKEQENWIDSAQDGEYQGFTFGSGNFVNDLGTTNRELIVRFYNLKNDICKQINKMADINDIPNNGTSFAHAGAFSGTYFDSGGGSISVLDMKGHLFGCFRSLTSGHNYNVFYFVLIVR